MAIEQNPDYVPETNEPSLEDMIRKLYYGNFSTGELERQLIAEIFRKMLDEQTPGFEETPHPSV